MRIITWNIQDCGTGNFKNLDVQNIQNILNTIEMENADIVIVQEYQNEYEKIFVKEGLEKMSYTCTVWMGDFDANLRKRVLIASKLSLEECKGFVDIQEYSKRNWNEIFVPQYNLNLLGVDVPLAETTDRYGKKGITEKKQFLEALKQKFISYEKKENPSIILGDFNLHEKAVFKECLDEFSSILTEITTKDATKGNFKFDYIFANNALMPLVDESKIYVPHATCFSDHKYLYIDICSV